MEFHETAALPQAPWPAFHLFFIRWQRRSHSSQLAPLTWWTWYESCFRQLLQTITYITRSWRSRRILKTNPLRELKLTSTRIRPKQPSCCRNNLSSVQAHLLRRCATSPSSGHRYADTHRSSRKNQKQIGIKVNSSNALQWCKVRKNQHKTSKMFRTQSRGFQSCRLKPGNRNYFTICEICENVTMWSKWFKFYEQTLRSNQIVQFKLPKIFKWIGLMCEAH